MSMDEKRLEKISKLIERMALQCERGIPLIVEGRKDEFTLKQLGVKGKIFMIKSHGESLLTFLEKLNGFKEVIILTDFDKEGNELASLIIDELSRRGIKVNDELRNKLKKLVNSEVSSIEDLKCFFERLKSKTFNRRLYTTTMHIKL
ncbi:MAG: toprim domain-containing protein [Candidatus Bathyarchaeia archaeon]